MLTEAKYHLSQNHVTTPLVFEGFCMHQVGRLHCGSNMEVPQHTHGGWFEITAVIDGKGEVFTDDVGTEVKQGDLYLSFPSDVHTIRSSKTEPLKYDFFSFSTQLSPYAQELDGILQRNMSPNRRLFHDRRIVSGIEHLTIAIDQNGKYAKLLAAALIREIVLYMIEDFDEAACEKNPGEAANHAENSTQELCFQIMNYIHTHMFTLKKLSELSTLTGYNYSYLSTLFKKSTSQTLRSYYREKRLEAARTLIKEEKLSAVRAAELLGYASPSAFGKAYKAQFGVSPLGEKDA